MTVKATNPVGSSAGSAASTLRVDTWAPLTQPTLNASSNGTSATLTWVAPADPGGATLTGWTITRTSPGGSPVVTSTGPTTTSARP